MARFEVQTAEMSGISVPVTVLQELVTYYSRTPERPQGVRLGDAFALPANIRQIEVGQGLAVVVQ
jgi:AMMECR1 domain-containing protein